MHKEDDEGDNLFHLDDSDPSVDTDANAPPTMRDGFETLRPPPSVRNEVKPKNLNVKALAGIAVCVLVIAGGLGSVAYNKLSKKSTPAASFEAPIISGGNSFNPYMQPSPAAGQPIIPDQGYVVSTTSNTTSTLIQGPINAPGPIIPDNGLQTTQSSVTSTTLESTATSSNAPRAVTPPTSTPTVTVISPETDLKIKNLEARIDALELLIEKRTSSAPVAQKSQVSSKQMVAESKPSKPVDGKSSPQPKEKSIGNLQIQAIVVGQAWIFNKNSGRVEVVQEGDSLSDGSRILKIDAAQHTVSTSRGTITGN